MVVKTAGQLTVYSQHQASWNMEETESWSEMSAQELMAKKDAIEEEIKSQNDILEGVSVMKD